MSQPMPINLNSPANLLFGTTLSACLGCAAGALLPVGAVGGAIFAAGSFLGSRSITWLSQRIECQDNLVVKVCTVAAITIGGIATGTFAATQCGYSMTLVSGITLALVEIGVILATTIVAGGCLCSSLVTSGLLLTDDRKTHTA